MTARSASRSTSFASVLAAAAAFAACSAPSAEAGAEAGAQAQAAPAPETSAPEAASARASVERIERGNLVIEGVPDIPAEVRERLVRYQNVRGHSFQGWTADGGALISTRFGEVSQIHHVAAPGGARRQLTFYDEPVSGAAARPDGAVFAFAKDTGGDEFYQGYVYDLATGDVTNFTEPGTRNGGMTWTDDGTRVAWYRATSGQPGWDILTADPSDPASLQVVYDTDDGALFAADWSDDNSTLLIQQYVSITKSRLFTLDVASGVLTEINPDADVAYGGAEFLPDGRILTVTDQDSEFGNLVILDPATNAMESLTDFIAWDVEEFALAPDGASAAFVVNEDGLGTITTVEFSPLRYVSGPELPPGIAFGLEYSPGGETLGFSFNSATSPTDVWSLDLGNGDLTRWTQAEVGGLDTSRFAEPELIRYESEGGQAIPAFVYKPAGEGPHPVIISIHGGPEAQYRPYFSSTFQYWLTELGAAVIAPNVRGSAGYGKTYVTLDNGLNRKRSVADIGALLDWVAEQPDLDSDRVLVYGGSYGGYMVLASMIDYGDRLAGGVNIVGISDFKTFLENTEGYRRDLRRVEYGDERDPEIAAFFEEISPLNNADKINKPLFIIQGANDPRVPASEAEQILAAVRANDGEAWYLLAMDEGHGFRKKSNRDYQREAETLFLRNVLDLN